MSQYRRILLIMTKTEQHPAALNRAMALADASGAALHVLGLYEPAEMRLYHELQDTPAPTASFLHFRGALEALLEECASHSTRASFEVVETTRPCDFALACIVRLAPDLVVKACPANSMFGQIAQASIDYALLHQCPGVFHFVPPDAPALPANVLVAVDVARSAPEQQALNHTLVEAGQYLASQCNGQVHLLSAYDLPLAMLANAALAEPWAEEVRDSLRLPFDALADAHGIPYLHRYFIQGAPLRVINAQVTSLRIDVVVVGVVQPKRWAKLIGDTTERLISHAPCSVLALKPKAPG